MKKILFFVLIIYNASFSQELPSEITEIDENSTEIPFMVIEHVPVYRGCNEFSDNEDLKKCMSDRILEHIAKKFNIDVAKGLGLPDGIVNINVIFKVNTKGEVVDVVATAPHTKLEEEAIRVINLIPKFDRAGYQRGKPVTVPYSLPIRFGIDNSKYKKKT
jgi:Gram-negative bacterial TonB protein C-terminal